ncbi:BON1-associated protein 2-like [Tripterygium wilfordii]|uniref:BON1-associated protein 2-like n=1 Tax=Tripterygium wilfordii TaxID=458696 RepID=UPI0018F84877|nr:BON1-associated protein 2-like [Tripterygium wilfordii]
MATLLRSLEITVLSAENLRKDGKSIKKNTFAVVKIDPFNSHSTKIDKGGSYPSWNDKLVMELPMHERFVTLEVHSCKGSNNNSRIIGTARMPVSDISGEYYTALDYLHFLSYRLRDEKGERNGIINVSVRAKAPPPGYNHACSKTVSLSVGPRLGLPMGGYINHAGVVTGVPVRCNYRA